jgi:hypothetical protein
MMKMTTILGILLLVLSLATSATAQAKRNEYRALSKAHGIGGREVAAPPWSAACVNDQGPQECGEPMWIYGSPDYLARFKNAF